MKTSTTTIRPSGECSAKAHNVQVQNVIPLPEIKRYLRAELRMSKRDADHMARLVYKDEATSKTNLPSGWHQAIWGPELGFTRRVGISDPTPVQAFKNIEAAA